MTDHNREITNVVLVHGAFADGSGWRGVHDNLTRRGYRVTIVQNPLTSLEDDVAATTRALDLQDGPTILVEYDNQQTNANHIHTVWRDLRHDFGGDLLAEHYRKHKHAKPAR